ncbi:type II toxin-antitoxin system death-on-curing family toxin [Roseimicrobium sp. ORNL1]|uniref:type II toxin-antitoxin system death-on-curing family toxin n=1 Tax=Roseimicrobium sp. ORNL1 TaxID=2711231 RepID=UPI00197E2A9F|nr:type II toxin-antitoxin system death-on-curing family toxin [Roseimicrobium sp. ORNL1]
MLQERSLHLFGGLRGVRDDGLIHSALASAENALFYGGGDLFDVAAAYAFHLAQAQAFFDGNKRTAVAAMLVFLEGNGVHVSNTHDDAIYDAIIAFAERRMGKAELAAFLRQSAGQM